MIQFREWQFPMIEHIADHPRCGVFAGMGSGKTMATLTAVQSAAELDEGPVLVIGPKRVANKTWPDEIMKWPHLRHLTISPILGSATQRFQALSRDTAIYTINDENVPWLVDHFGPSKWPFRTVIKDELTRWKGFRLKQGRKRAAAFSRVAFGPVKRFIGLTGTPSPNGLKDLWGQLWFMDKGERLGRTFDGFKERWFQSDYDGTVKPVSWAQDQIQEKIRDICLSIDPTDYIDVPEPISNVIKVELPPKARAMYREMEKQMFLQIREHEIEAVHAAAKTIKLLQLANGAIYLNPERTLWEPIHEAKIEALDSIIDEANGMPVLVAYHFKTDLERLQKAFPFGTIYDDKPATEDAWNEGRYPLMFIHPASGGHGTNLQYGGNILAFFGHWWDMELRMQVIERIGPLRQFQSGLNRLVTIHDIVAEDTVDEDVILRHQTKRAVQDILMDAMKRRG